MQNMPEFAYDGGCSWLNMPRQPNWDHACVGAFHVNEVADCFDKNIHQVKERSRDKICSILAI